MPGVTCPVCGAPTYPIITPRDGGYVPWCGECATEIVLPPDPTPEEVARWEEEGGRQCGYE